MQDKHVQHVNVDHIGSQNLSKSHHLLQKMDLCNTNATKSVNSQDLHTIRSFLPHTRDLALQQPFLKNQICTHQKKKGQLSMTKFKNILNLHKTEKNFTHLLWPMVPKLMEGKKGLSK